MKKVFSVFVAILMLLSAFGTISVSAATALPFTQNFEGYNENATITNSGLFLTPGNATVNGANVLKTNFTAVTDSGSMAMQIALNPNAGVSSASSRFQINDIDTSNLRDMTISFDYKAVGGASLTLSFVIDTAISEIMSASNTDWASYTIALDFEKLEGVLSKNGTAVKTIKLASTLRTSALDLRFATGVNAAKSHLFDNISVTTSGEAYSQERADAYNAGIVIKAPYVAGPDERPVVILKADDLSVTNYAAFKEIYDVLHKHDIVAGFGAITYGCEEFTDEQWAEINTWVDNGFEIWHHGYKHNGVYVDGVFQNNADFIGRTAAEMEMYINHGIDLFAEHGITVQCIGAPYNRTDDTFVETINNRFPGRITSTMYCSDNADAYNLENRLNIEADGMTQLEAITTSYAGKPGLPYYVLQFHASKQDGSAIAGFEEAILYLAEESNCVFMTPSQYIEYIEGVANEGKLEMEGITFENKTVTFNGEAQSITITGALPEGATIAYTNAENTAIGTHHARALIKKAGYKDLVLTADLTIEAPIVAEPIADLQISADGTTVTYSANSNADGSYFVLSLYDAEGKACGTKIAAVNGPISGTVTASKAPASYKVFILKSFVTMQIGSSVITGTL